MIEFLIIAGIIAIGILVVTGLFVASVYRIRYEDAIEYLDEED